ncbi:glycosyltransferase [Pseudomonas sp. 65/3-MNA-CIBAN-0223]|uniref:glycosyltransferase n=1 Tax=Pseudomonas sp. 65/3-MNA-CIBAN-0223 TaxID=3140476 RepID=UPI00331FC5B7
MLNVLICGPYPAPIGGISIHIQRLAQLANNLGIKTSICDESATIKPDTFNIRSLNIIKYIKLIYSADIVHIHSSVGILRLCHLLFAFIMKKPIVVTIHSWRHGEFSSFVWTKLLSTLSTHIILVNREISERLQIPAKIIQYFPAFIPPLDAGYELPVEIEYFIETARLQGKKIVSSNAYRIMEYHGQELYGLDLCIEAFSSSILSDKAVLIFSISDPSFNREKIEQYKKFISDRQLGNTIYLQIGAIDYYNLLKLSDLSIRATNTDGDAISVRESLFLNKPCIASDCIKRPEGTYLFENRSATSLAKVIKKALRAADEINASTESLQKIENFYQNLYAGNR